MQHNVWKIYAEEHIFQDSYTLSSLELQLTIIFIVN